MKSKDFKVAKRYAKALWSLAKEHQIGQRTYDDMKYLDVIFSSSNELRAIMKSPVVREGKKQRVLQSLLSNQLHPLNMGYVKIVVRKQRASLLPGIARAFQLVYKEAMGIELVQITTAIPLNETLRQKAMGVARKFSDLEIEFNEKVDPGIIGGFVLNLGDRLYDASIRRRMSVLRKQLKV